jgi:GDPmannose 4,6-dehydratase
LGIAKILNNIEKDLVLGNLDAKRDWGFAKDYVYGMWLMLQQDTPDDYVLSTNEQHSVREFVEICFAKKNIQIIWEGKGLNEVGKDAETGRILVRVDSKYYRPCEVTTLLGDSTKAKNKLGWTASTSFDQLVTDMLNHDCASFKKCE